MCQYGTDPDEILWLLSIDTIFRRMGRCSAKTGNGSRFVECLGSNRPYSINHICGSRSVRSKD